MLEYEVIDATASCKGLLGNLGRVLVADNRIQSRHDTDAVVHIGTATILVGRDALDATDAQRVEAVHQQVQLVQNLETANNQLAHQLSLKEQRITQLETELERRLLEMDGKVPACSQDLSRHIRLTPGECETVAKFYPPASSRNVEQAIKNMAFFTGLLCTPEGAKRTVLTKGIDLVAPEFRGMVMTSGADPQCSHLDEPMMEAYNRAAEDFPEMLSQLQAHMTYSAPFGAEFEGIFG